MRDHPAAVERDRPAGDRLSSEQGLLASRLCDRGGDGVQKVRFGCAESKGSLLDHTGYKYRFSESSAAARHEKNRRRRQAL